MHVGRYDFTTTVDRRNSHSVKWDSRYLEKLCGNPQAIPFWVADMDFRSPPEVLEALHSRIDHGIFGYLSGSEEAFEAFAGWVKQRYAWKVDIPSICFTPGIIAALSAAVEVFTLKGDGIIIQTPAYRPFFTVIRDQGRRVLENPLSYRNGSYGMDMEHLESLMKQASMLILCSPHNPSGRVWKREELAGIAELAKRHGVLVVSDEIHADMTYPGYTHIPYSSMSGDGITCMAPSKTFNIPGEHFSCIVIPDEKQRSRFTDRLRTLSISEPTILSFTAALAAYRGGGPWLDELIELLVQHVDLMDSALTCHAPEIKLVRPEASFIAFLDCSEVLNRIGNSQDLVQLLGTRGGIALHRGSWFGRAGRNFIRINFGTPTSLLEDGLSKLTRVIRSL